MNQQSQREFLPTIKNGFKRSYAFYAVLPRVQSQLANEPMGDDDNNLVDKVLITGTQVRATIVTPSYGEWLIGHRV